MSINTIEYAKIFTEALDTQLVEGSTTGWMEANSGQVKYNGGNEVKIPKIVLSGMGDYDRDLGFAQGSVTLTYETRKLSQDRGRTFQIDASDVDETNFALVAGNIMGEFQRTKVIPEIDAYRYSRLYKIAEENGRTGTYTPSSSTIFSELLKDITAIRDVVGDGSEIIVTMSAVTANMLDMAKGGSNIIESAEFKQGDAKIKVRSIDGCPIIRVPSLRLKTSYDFFDGSTGGEESGGFSKADDAKDINWIIAVKDVPIAVSKTDVTRIFDPITNQKANAWKIDYRKYHDIWVMDNALEGLWVSTKA